MLLLQSATNRPRDTETEGTKGLTNKSTISVFVSATEIRPASTHHHHMTTHQPMQERGRGGKEGEREREGEGWREMDRERERQVGRYGGGGGGGGGGRQIQREEGGEKDWEAWRKWGGKYWWIWSNTCCCPALSTKASHTHTHTERINNNRLYSFVSTCLPPECLYTKDFRL